jgi:hypothetical protein
MKGMPRDPCDAAGTRLSKQQSFHFLCAPCGPRFTMIITWLTDTERGAKLEHEQKTGPDQGV